VPDPFVHLSPELLDACRRGTVLTPTERLRRELVGAYDAAMAARGCGAWPSADAFSLDGWFSHLHRSARAEDPSLPRLLDGTAELLLWQATAPAGQEALAALARDAWALARQWRMPLDERALGRTENGRLFRTWAREFTHALAERHAATRAELPGLLSERWAGRPEHVCCFAFESTPVAVRACLASLEAAGTTVTWLDDSGLPRGDSPDREHQRVWRLELPDRRAEIGAAAQWCRDLLMRDPRARIGVVVPDLAGRYQAVERQFAAWLEPVGSAGDRRAFDLAGGTPLSDQAVWREAERWLRFCFDRLPAAEARRMLAGTYLSLPALPGLPAELPETFTLADVAALGRDPEWRRLSHACPSGGEQRPFDSWLERFRQALEQAGWTGRGAGSVQFQAFQQCRELLAEAGRARTYQRQCDAPTALTVLGRLARQRLFAPQRARAPVQILGYLETTGLSFTHLWITGLEDDAWPASAQVNPFVPLSLQREHAVPRIDPPGELEFAARRLQSWQRSTRALVYSHGVQDDDTRHEPSPLIRELPATAPEHLIPGLTFASHPAFTSGGTTLVGGSREAATPLHHAVVRGGSGLLRDQALCPFRRWAVHRLNLDQPPEPHGFPDARDRGALVHEVLHRALDREAETPRHPGDIEAAALEELLSRVLAERYRRFPAPVRDAERERLHRVLRRWLAVEAQRSPFTVTALEHEVELNLAGLTLRLRFDRADQVDGVPVVLDYKTGRTQPQRLFDQRLTEPQLPLYALADPAIRGVLFMEIGDDDVLLTGVAARAESLAPARLVPLAEDWDTVREAWRERLVALALEILRGRADVAPVGPAACRICHLQPFCRIHEHPRAVEDDTGADAGEDVP
jgi:hypothetical protein